MSEGSNRIYVQSKVLPRVVEADIDTYRKFIVTLLTTRGKATPEEALAFTAPGSMMGFVKAVTHESVNLGDPAANYEMMEHLGDTSVNKSLTWYLARRFPPTDGKPKALSLQEALLKSKKVLAGFSDRIGL